MGENERMTSPAVLATRRGNTPHLRTLHSRPRRLIRRLASSSPTQLPSHTHSPLRTPPDAASTQQAKHLLSLERAQLPPSPPWRLLSLCPSAESLENFAQHSHGGEPHDNASTHTRTHKQQLHPLQSLAEVDSYAHACVRARRRRRVASRSAAAACRCCCSIHAPSRDKVSTGRIASSSSSSSSSFYGLFIVV